MFAEILLYSLFPNRALRISIFVTILGLACNASLLIGTYFSKGQAKECFAIYKRIKIVVILLFFINATLVGTSVKIR